MAILKDSITLTEDILNRHEKSVIRGIYRASQLDEALKTLEKISEICPESAGTAHERLPSTPEYITQVNALKVFLAEQVVKALISTKVPQTSTSNKVPNVP